MQEIHKPAKKKDSKNKEKWSKTTTEKSIQKKDPPAQKYQIRRKTRRDFDDECWGPGKKDPEEEEEVKSLWWSTVTQGLEVYYRLFIEGRVGRAGVELVSVVEIVSF